MKKKDITIANLTHIEKDDNGVVKFYEDEAGNIYQSLNGGEPFKVIDGRMKYILIKRIAGYNINYNTNGLHGYSIWKGDTCWGDNYWAYEYAENWTAGQFSTEEWTKIKKLI